MIEKNTKEYSKFFEYYSIRNEVVEKFLRSNTFLPFGLEAIKIPTIFTENVPLGAPAATDFNYIYINPNDPFYSKCGVNKLYSLTFAYLHEIMHNIFKHHIRGEGKDIHLWRYATDYFINLFLWNLERENKNWDEQQNLIVMLLDKYKDEVLFNEKFSNMIEEEIYTYLQQNGNFQKEESEESYKDFLDKVGLPNENVSEDSKIKITKTELTIDGKVEKKTFVDFPKQDVNGSQEESTNKFDSELAKTMFETRILSKGFESSSFEKFIKQIFTSKVPWDVILRDSILVELEKKGDISYSRPRLSWLANPSLPYLANITEEEVYGTLVLLIDESGSMTEEDIVKAVNIAQQADSYYKNIFVIKHDVVSKWSKLYEDKITQKDLDELCVRRHTGGTSHRDAFQKVLDFEKQHNTFVSLVLCLTDMCSDIEESQKILPSRIPRIYLKVLDYSTTNIIGKVINVK